jgi:hypothetical protein
MADAFPKVSIRTDWSTMTFTALSTTMISSCLHDSSVPVSWNSHAPLAKVGSVPMLAWLPPSLDSLTSPDAGVQSLPVAKSVDAAFGIGIRMCVPLAVDVLYFLKITIYRAPRPMPTLTPRKMRSYDVPPPTPATNLDTRRVAGVNNWNGLRPRRPCSAADNARFHT